jgi:hypothetical protein
VVPKSEAETKEMFRVVSGAEQRNEEASVGVCEKVLVVGVVPGDQAFCVVRPERSQSERSDPSPKTLVVTP